MEIKTLKQRFEGFTYLFKFEERNGAWYITHDIDNGILSFGHTDKYETLQEARKEYHYACDNGVMAYEARYYARALINDKEYFDKFAKDVDVLNSGVRITISYLLEVVRHLDMKFELLTTMYSDTIIDEVKQIVDTFKQFKADA